MEKFVDLVCNCFIFYKDEPTMFIFTHREIVETMVKAYKQRFFTGQMPVFDGRKNLYSRDALPIGREKVNNYVIMFYVIGFSRIFFFHFVILYGILLMFSNC